MQVNTRYINSTRGTSSKRMPLQWHIYLTFLLQPNMLMCVFICLYVKPFWDQTTTSSLKYKLVLSYACAHLCYLVCLKWSVYMPLGGHPFWGCYLGGVDIYLVFTCMPGMSYCRWLRASVVVPVWDVSRGLINSLACWPKLLQRPVWSIHHQQSPTQVTNDPSTHWLDDVNFTHYSV